MINCSTVQVILIIVSKTKKIALAMPQSLSQLILFIFGYSQGVVAPPPPLVARVGRVLWNIAATAAACCCV